MVLKKRKFTVSFSKSLNRSFSFQILFRNIHFFQIFRDILGNFFFFFDIILRVVIVLKKRKFTFHGFVLGKFESMVQILLRNINFSKYFALFLVIFFFRHYFARHNRSVSIPFRKKKKKKREIRSMRNLNRNSRRNLSFRITNFVYALCF